MVKRPKSPEIVEDARYFTVYQPYPLNANWIIEEEQMRCAMWVAECIGLNHLWAIHHKPKARGMILLEISKAYTDHGNFLGEHRWSEMLKNPSDEEKQSVSQVFHSFYAKGRDAQKDGWKVLPVKNKWFKDWAPGKGAIRQPYPATHWCAVPVEDRTNKTLCRPLPVEQKPPPPRSHLPVVGSSKWVEKQVEGPPTYAGLSNAWAAKPPMLDTSRANDAPPVRTPSAQSPAALSPESAGPGLGNTINVKATGAITGTKSLPLPAQGKSSWGKPVPLKKFTAPDSRSTKASTWAPVQATASLSGAKSPLAEPAPKGPANAWARPLKIVPSEVPAKGNSSPSSAANSPWAQTASLTPASPWGQPSALAPASPWGQPSALEPVPASAPPTNGSYTQLESAPKKNNAKGKAKASSPPVSNTSPRGNEQPLSLAKGNNKEEKFMWSDEPAYFPTTSGAVAEVGFEAGEETVEDLETEILSPWETKTPSAWSKPPGVGDRKGKSKAVEEKSAWGSKSGKPGHQNDSRKNGKPAGGNGADKSRKSSAATAAVAYNPAMDWKTEPSTSNSWGDMPLTLGSNNANGQPANTPDWQVEVSESNSWGDKPLTMAAPDEEEEAVGTSGWNGGPVLPTDVDVDWRGEPMAHGDVQEWTHEETAWDNLWLEEPANDKPPELICPTHNIACKKGICRDMARLVREQERKEREKGWAEQRARGKGRGRGRGRGGRGDWRERDGGRGRGGGHNRTPSVEGSQAENGEAEMDEDGFTTARKTRRGKKKEPSYIGRMRGFEDEPQVAEAKPAEPAGETAPKDRATTSASEKETDEDNDADDADDQNDGEIENTWAADHDGGDWYD